MSSIFARLLPFPHCRREEEHIWPAAKVFATYLTSASAPALSASSNPGTVVEVGAGTGLVSLVIGAKTAATACADESPGRIIATDCDKAALKNMRANVAQNQLAGVVSVEEWNWLDDKRPHWSESVTMIIGSDFVYDNHTAYLHLSRNLASILCRPSAPNKAQKPVALFMLQARGEHGYPGSSVEAFINDLRARGLEAVDLSLPSSCTAHLFDTSPALVDRLHLFRIAAPCDETQRRRVDYTSPPGFHGRLEHALY